MSEDKLNGKMSFESSVCFKFWKTLQKLDIEYVGWRLSAYWRERGYDV